MSWTHFFSLSLHPYTLKKKHVCFTSKPNHTIQFISSFELKTSPRGRSLSVPGNKDLASVADGGMFAAGWPLCFRACLRTDARSPPFFFVSNTWRKSESENPRGGRLQSFRNWAERARELAYLLPRSSGVTAVFPPFFFFRWQKVFLGRRSM